MNKALKDLQHGDRVQLFDPDGIGRIIKITYPVWLQTTGGKAIKVRWERVDNGEIGWYVGDQEDVVAIAP